MVVTSISVPSKLVDIPQDVDLSKNFCYATLLKSHFCMDDLPYICYVFAEHLF